MEIPPCVVCLSMTPAHPTLSRKRRGCLLHVLWLFTVGCSLGFAASDPVRLFDVPAATADKSLKRFSEQAGLEVIFSTRITREVTTQPVKGEMTGRQALNAMLAGTGLALIQDEKSGAFTVSPDPNGKKAATTAPDDPPRGANGSPGSNSDAPSAPKKKAPKP